MPTRVENIAERGVRRRRAQGIAWTIIGVIAAVALVSLDAPKAWRLALALPFAFAALGLLQARERTCVFLGAIDKRENPDGSYSEMPAEDCPAIKRRVAAIVVRVVLIAVAATALAWSL